MLFDFVLERYPQIIATVVTLILFFILKRFADSLVNRFGQRAHFPKARVQLVKKYIDFLLATLVSVVIVSIWGVKPDQIFLFFSFPFKIGDKIRILDKECPIEAEIKDINSFYTLLITASGEHISLPNNVLLQKAVVIVEPNEV